MARELDDEVGLGRIKWYPSANERAENRGVLRVVRGDTGKCSHCHASRRLKGGSGKAEVARGRLDAASVGANLSRHSRPHTHTFRDLATSTYI